MIRFSQPSFEETAGREWLVTNGLGGYASSTLSGANTRRYHGLLVAALNPPTGRTVIVSKVEETLDGAALATNQYPGVVYPEGYHTLESFERDPLPKSVFRINKARLSKTVFMIHGMNATIVTYQNEGEKAVQLEINPLLVFRDYHSLFHADNWFDFYVEKLAQDRLKVYAHYGAPPLWIGFEGGAFRANPVGYRNFEYEKETERGLDSREDAKSIGLIIAQLQPGQSFHLIFSLDERVFDHKPEEWKNDELLRLKELGAAAGNHPFLRDLMVAGDQFIVRRQSTESYSIIAGYHWFADWGRDTMIAMRGLTVAAGNQETSRSIIHTFLKYLDGGMLPNRFPDQGEMPEYNTIDATLWLFITLYEYHLKFGDTDFLEEIFPALTNILESHISGTRYNIHVTDEGLLFGGEGLAQLTWMDARVGDYVVTPRQGCPVEVNALWYNALKIYAEFAKTLNKEIFGFHTLAMKAKNAFRKYFINDKGYLNDVIIPGEYTDEAIRPNQVYALSLPFDLLTVEEARSVMKVVEAHLYTDLGLRSLNPENPDFKSVYQGDQWERDTAYHQGTVWAYLWPEYALAYLKMHQFSPESQNTILAKLKPLKRHFYEEGCLRGIAEIFDGVNPDTGKGCIQQAWSVGMLIKLLCDIRDKTAVQPVRRSSGRKSLSESKV